MEKKILDVTCGARSIWFNKHHPAAVYCDKRREQYHHLWKNAGNCMLDINPDVVCDFTNLPFTDNSFHLECLNRMGCLSLSGLSMTFQQRMFGKPLGKSLYLGITAGSKAVLSGRAL